MELGTHGPNLFILVFSVLLPSVYAEIKTMDIVSDDRPLVLFEQFGFSTNGRTSASVSSVSWSPTANSVPSSFGFFLLSDAFYFRIINESHHTDNFCPLSSNFSLPILTFQDLQNSAASRTIHISTPEDYGLFFANCALSSTRVTMQVRTEMYNVDEDGRRDYLPVGRTRLPAVYMAFFLVYCTFLGAWVFVCRRQRMTVEAIHMVMATLLLFKALKLACAAEDLWHVQRRGSHHGWDVAFYVFGFFKGVLLFTVIVLIGTGWSVLKPYLQEREKSVLKVIIPLQVLENIATAVIGEGGAALKDWLSWIQLLLIVDIACCCLVFFPIVWSINSLREASAADGKAARNVKKLTLFKQFYVVVVGYLYFTRIVASAVGAVISYRYWWLVTATVEAASLGFYAFVFYNFQPVDRNPYLYIANEKVEEEAAGVLEMEGFLDK